MAKADEFDYNFVMRVKEFELFERLSSVDCPPGFAMAEVNRKTEKDYPVMKKLVRITTILFQGCQFV